MSRLAIFKALAATIPAVISVAAAGQAHLPAYDTRVNPEFAGTTMDGEMIHDGRWPASWIISEGADKTYGVYMFRKSLDLAAVPETCIVNVSADSRYKLYVNGAFVGGGPAKCDVANWSFDTFDLATYMHTGKNAVSALVWNLEENNPVAVMSIGKPGFLLQGNGQAEQDINTGRQWKAMRCNAYSPEPVKVRGYYAAGACDRMDSSVYPWGWQDEDFDDSTWAEAVTVSKAATKGARDYNYWQLVPRPIPPMEIKPAGNIKFDPVTVPGQTSIDILLDAGVLMTGYPQVRFSGGKGAQITITYAEAPYEGPGYKKGRRDVTEGKDFIGYSDVIVADGGNDRCFEPLWWRTWRYLKITVKTLDEPVTLDGVTADSSMYPFEKVSTFSAPGAPELDKMLEIGWRTARLCAHETYMDCPYYEQLQYFGDARIQELVTLYNTRDTCMVRNLVEHGRQSMTAEGLTTSRYPEHILQIIPPYSLVWINICHDLWMYRGEEAYLAGLLPATRSVLHFFSSHLDEEGLLGGVPYWNFCDWTGWKSGVLPFDASGKSAYMDLMHLLALKDAAEMERVMGSAAIAEEYEALIRKIGASVRKKYWDGSRRLFANNTAKDSFSQHVNALAILADLVEGEQAKSLMNRIMDEKDITPCTIYFRFYLQMAMAHSGCGDRLLDDLGVLRDQMDLGLTTWAEMPEPSRSDCHAWGASPNIEFHRMVLGIDSAAPGFRKVRIAPCPGHLKEASGSIPHPDGDVKVSWRLGNDGRISAEIELPEGTTGTFVWHCKSRRLKAGNNRVSIK